MQITTTLQGSIEVVLTGVMADDGAVVCPEARTQTITRNGDGTVAYVEFTEPPYAPSGYAGGVYRQTYSYSAGKLTGVSKWTKQP